MSSFLKYLEQIVQYKVWADEVTYKVVSKLADNELTRQRKTRFGNILHTLNHVYVIDDIFRAHILNQSHSYTARNTLEPFSFSELCAKQKNINSWYNELAQNLTEEKANEIINFNYVDGLSGRMTRAEIVIHQVNHATYHRGFISSMLYEIPITMPANDFTVFIRDIYQEH